MPVPHAIKRRRKEAIRSAPYHFQPTAIGREEMFWQLESAARFRRTNVHRLKDRPAGIRMVDSHRYRISLARNNRIAIAEIGFRLP